MSSIPPSEDKGVTPISVWTIVGGLVGVLGDWILLNPDVTNVPADATWVDLARTLIPALSALGGALLAWYKAVKPNVTPTESPKIEIQGRLVRLVPEATGRSQPGANF
jgi:hypothetical protein